MIEGVLLKPLPYPSRSEFVVLDHAAPGMDLKNAGAAPFLYFTYREQGRVFQDVAMWQADTESVTGLAEPEEVQSVVVTDGCCRCSARRRCSDDCLRSRTIHRAGRTPLILTAGYWRTRFGSEPSAIGRRICSTAARAKSSASSPTRSAFSIGSRR